MRDFSSQSLSKIVSTICGRRPFEHGALTRIDVFDDRLLVDNPVLSSEAVGKEQTAYQTTGTCLSDLGCSQLVALSDLGNTT